MKTTMKVIGGLAAVFAVLAFASCNISADPSDELVAAAKELKTVIPAIQAGMSLAVPDDPADRALTPLNLKSTGATTGNNWTYAGQTPQQVYGTGTTKKRFPASGNYEYPNGDQCYFTLIPESLLGGAPYYRMVLYTYPAFDLSVAYTTEEYIVNSDAVTPGWPWGNLNLALQLNSWISLTTVYLDGTSGTRNVGWVGSTGSYYDAFSVADPDPLVTSSFDGYRIEDPVPPPGSFTMDYSSQATEILTGKKVSTESTQYYTETSATVHSGLTKVYMDRKHKWAEDTYIVTRMEENTGVGIRTKKIRSVGEVGATQYYIDKIDIALSDGKIVYSSTHDVYDTVLPRGGNPKAKDYVALDLAEDAAEAGTFTGTLVETQGDNEITRDVKVNRDSLNKFQVTMKYKSSKARPKTITNDVVIPLTQQGLGGFSIPIQSVGATFTGYYEAGMLSGTIQMGSRTYEVVVAEEGVAFDDVLYPY